MAKDSDHGLQEQENSVYRSLRNADARVTKASLRRAIQEVAGLDITRDERLSSLRSELENADDTATLSSDEFERLLHKGGRLALRALQGDLVVPDFQMFKTQVEKIFSEISDIDPIGQEPSPPQNPPRLAVFDKDYSSARNADYIPSLSNVPDAWGVAICTVDGQTISLGADEIPFSIQSCCKPINYCQALETFNRREGDRVGIEGGSESPEEKDRRKRHREEARKLGTLGQFSETNLGVHDFIDCEPSGQPFNEFSFKKQTGIPYNALINAGAITCSALVSGARAPYVSMQEIQDVWKRLAGMKERPRYDPETAGGEKDTGLNNISLAYKLGNLEALPSFIDSAEKIDRILEFYFNCCSLTLTANQMAVAAATLANRGVCPLTGDRVFHSSTVTNCLAAMLHCGMYDSSGKFGRLVGLPAKSGVGGGILVVVPGVMGICTFSPRLDRIGNSLRGLRFYERLLEQYALHMLELPSIVGDRKLDITISHLRSRHQAIQEIVSAASLGDVDAIKQFEYDAGSPVTYLELLQAADYDGRTPLHLASAEGREAVVKYLLEKEVDPQPLDRWKQTPLADAQRAGHASIVSLLEDAIRAKGDTPIKADPSPSNQGITARDQSRTKFAQFVPIPALTPEQLEIIWASAEGDLETLRRHVAKGNNLHIRDYDDRTPLHLATAQAKTDVVGFLVNYHIESLGSNQGEPVDEDARAARLSWPDRWGRTPLDEAKDPRVLPSAQSTEEQIRAGLPRCIELLQGGGALTGDAFLVST
jgi:glutaminase